MTRAAAQKYLPSWHARQRQRQHRVTATDVLLALMCRVRRIGYNGCTVYTGSIGPAHAVAGGSQRLWELHTLAGLTTRRGKPVPEHPRQQLASSPSLKPSTTARRWGILC